MDEQQRRLAEAACRYQMSVAQQAHAAGQRGDSWSPAFMAQLGHHVMAATRPKQPIGELLGGVAELADRELARGNREEAAILYAMVTKPPDNMILTACARWAHAALPQVTMGHKYAAALMCTVVPDEVLEDIRAPWEAFLIQVPNGLVHFVDGRDRLVSVRAVLVTREPDDGRWSYVALCEPSADGISDTIYYQNLNTAWGLLNPGTSVATARDIGDLFARDMEDIDTRSAMLLGRLVLSTCLAMSDPSNVTPPKASKPKNGKGKRRGGLPSIRTYKLGKPIKIDCRSQVQAYSRGERQPPQVQVLVRGHWKRQPCGPGLKDRRVIWIEPYPRGPEDAPINLRAHNLRRASSSGRA